MISLYIPALDDYYYEAKVNSDPKTMSYNAGYNLKDESIFPKSAGKKNTGFASMRNATLPMFMMMN